MSQSRRTFAAIFLTLVSLGIAAAGGYFLYRDLTQSMGGGNGPAMAKLERKEARVRRKTSTSYLWSPIQSGDDLYRKDSIQTESGGSASIQMNDGTVLELGEESLVILDNVNDMSMNFLKGTAVVRGDGGDKKLSVGRDGKTHVEQLPIRLIQPALGARYFLAADAKIQKSTRSITFSWAWKNPTESEKIATVLQISPDRTFSPNRTQSQSISDLQQTQTTFELAQGKYFWRVTQNGKPITETRILQLTSASPLNPVWPTAQDSVRVFGEKVPIQFRWGKPQSLSNEETFPGHHEIEIATDPQFRQILRTQTIAAESGSASLTGLKNGIYYWRIKSQYGDIKLHSANEKLALLYSEKPTLALVSPESEDTTEPHPSLRFSWDSDSRDLEFEFELEAITFQGNRPVIKEKVRTLSFLVKNAAPATYRWRVLAWGQGANDNAKKIIAETEWRKYTVFSGKPIIATAPQNQKILHYWDKPPLFAFEWRDESFREDEKIIYQLEIARDPKFQDRVQTFQTSTPKVLSSSLKPLADGVYHWRVKALDRAENPLRASSPQQIQWGVFPPLRSPASLQPESGQSYDIVRSDERPTLQWQSLADAVSYEVTIQNNQQAIVLQKQTSDTQLKIEKLPEGDFTWTIRGIDRIGRKGEPSRPLFFRITYGELLPAPELTSPEVQ